MKVSAVAERLSGWIDGTADAVVALSDHWAKPPVVKFIEECPGEFSVQSDGGSKIERVRIADGRFDRDLSAGLATLLSGSRVEVRLRPEQMIFRQIELPARASEFLSGILRAQIDSLTPWNAVDCAFGWSTLVQEDPDRIIVTVAATALDFVRPYTSVMTKAGALSVSISTTSHRAGDERVIKIWEERAAGSAKIESIRRMLTLILVAASFIATVAGATSVIRSASLEAEQEEIANQIATARATAGATMAAESHSAAAALNRLLRRKHDTPMTVVILENLSRLLPDHTYLSELRVEGNKLRIIGTTHDAPSLIGLLEQSGFAQASFFAPTTRTPSSSERFHIEATIQSPPGSGS